MSLARPGRKQATATDDFDVHISYLSSYLEEYVYYIYKTRLASKEIFPSSNKLNRKVGRAKDLSAPRYSTLYFIFIRTRDTVH